MNMTSISEKEIANLNTLSQYLDRLKVKLEQALRIAKKLSGRKSGARFWGTTIGLIPRKYDPRITFAREQKLIDICKKALPVSEALINQTIDAVKPLQPTTQFQKLVTRLNATLGVAKAALRIWEENMALQAELLSTVDFKKETILDYKILQNELELDELFKRLGEIEQDRTYLDDLKKKLAPAAKASVISVGATSLFAAITELGAPLPLMVIPLVIASLMSLITVSGFFFAFGEAKELSIQRQRLIEKPA